MTPVFPQDQIPPLDRRYMSTGIDLVFLMLALALTAMIPGDNEFAINTRRVFLFGIVFLYEPFLTSFGSTLGQWVIGIRVRRIHQPDQRINLITAYLRWIIKVLFGVFSFIMAFFSRNRMTLHDLVAGSIVLNANSYVLEKKVV